MAACSYPWKNIQDPVMAEARACLQAVTLAEDMGFLDVCIEGDALTIIRKLRARAANRATHAMAKDGGHYEHPRI